MATLLWVRKAIICSFINKDWNLCPLSNNSTCPIATEKGREEVCIYISSSIVQTPMCLEYPSDGGWSFCSLKMEQRQTLKTCCPSLEKMVGGRRRQAGRGTHTAWCKARSIWQLTLHRSTGAQRRAGRSTWAGEPARCDTSNDSWAAKARANHQQQHWHCDYMSAW